MPKSVTIQSSLGPRIVVAIGLASWLIGIFPGYCCDTFLARDGVDPRPLARRGAVAEQQPLVEAFEHDFYFSIYWA